MFGRAGSALDRNTIICLAIAAGALLLAGLLLAVNPPTARAQPAPRTTAAQAGHPGAKPPPVRVSAQFPGPDYQRAKTIYLS
jgi:hypothetical protein